MPDKAWEWEGDLWTMLERLLQDGELHAVHWKWLAEKLVKEGKVPDKGKHDLQLKVKKVCKKWGAQGRLFCTRAANLDYCSTVGQNILQLPKASEATHPPVDPGPADSQAMSMLQAIWGFATDPSVGSTALRVWIVGLIAGLNPEGPPLEMSITDGKVLASYKPRGKTGLRLPMPVIDLEWLLSIGEASMSGAIKFKIPQTTNPPEQFSEGPP